MSGEDRLQPVLAARAEGRLRMWESYRGAVVDVHGDTVLVQYDVNGSVIEQTYERSQFLAGRLPSVGDELEVHVIVADARPLAADPDPEEEHSDDLSSPRRQPLSEPTNF